MRSDGKRILAGKGAPQVKRGSSAVPLLPALVAGARPDHLNIGSDWTVESGTTKRGDSYCDFEGLVVRAPRLDLNATDKRSDQAKAIRLHELAHLRLSPKLSSDEFVAVAKANKVPVRLLQCCEELRVNNVLVKAGFDITALSDGTEQHSGETVAPTANGWNEALAFAIATWGTPAHKAFLKGFNKARPEWREAMKQALREVGKTWRSHSQIASMDSLGVTPRTGDIWFPEGFNTTIDMARIMVQFWAADQVEGTGDVSEATALGGEMLEGHGQGVWQSLKWDTQFFPKQPVIGALMARRRTPSQSGKTARYITRAVGDPQKRVFAGRAQDKGGVVFIDISGSMSVSDHDIEAMLDSAPFATIFLYSGRPGGMANGYDQMPPNCWLVAWQGHRLSRGEVEYVSQGNVGNCCDGPALLAAVQLASGAQIPFRTGVLGAHTLTPRRGVPVVWVCDGQLTDGNDGVSTVEMDLGLIPLLRRFSVVCVASIPEAVVYLRTRKSVRMPRGRFGLRVPKSQGGWLGLEGAEYTREAQAQMDWRELCDKMSLGRRYVEEE